MGLEGGNCQEALRMTPSLTHGLFGCFPVFCLDGVSLLVLRRRAKCKSHVVRPGRQSMCSLPGQLGEGSFGPMSCFTYICGDAGVFQEF